MRAALHEHMYSQQDTYIHVYDTPPQQQMAAQEYIGLPWTQTCTNVYNRGAYRKAAVHQMALLAPFLGWIYSSTSTVQGVQN